MEPPSVPHPPPSPEKLRFMCSYGGNIIPSPQTKSLYYAGGDTRIVTVPVPSNGHLSLSSLVSHLASTLHLPYAFTLKYQLPSHDLDSLISVSNDEDILVMLDEHRLASSAPSRIRLFLYPSSSGCGIESNLELKHPKRESFFVDALKGVVGFNGEDGSSGVLNGAESINLETSSSFGSTSSSASLSNLPVRGLTLPEEPVGGYFDKKTRLLKSDLTSCDHALAALAYNPLSGRYQDISIPFTSVENSLMPTNTMETGIKHFDPSVGVEVPRSAAAASFPQSMPMEQLQQQAQFVPAASAYYVAHNHSAYVPVPSYYSLTSQQQPLYYQTSQSQAIYYVPVRQTYDVPVSGALNSSMMPIASSRPPLHPNTAVNVVRVGHNATAVASQVPEMVAPTYRPAPMVSPLDVPHQENHNQANGPELSHPPLSDGGAITDSASAGNDQVDDPALLQIYKSQPPPPPLSAQFQTANKPTFYLSEALEQLNVDNTMQQQRGSHTQ